MIDSLWKKMSKLYFIDFFCRISIKKLEAHFWLDIVVTASSVFLSLLEQDGFLSVEWSFGRSETSEIRWVQWKHEIFGTWDWRKSQKKNEDYTILHFHDFFLMLCFGVRVAIQSICRGRNEFLPRDRMASLEREPGCTSQMHEISEHSWQACRYFGRCPSLLVSADLNRFMIHHLDVLGGLGIRRTLNW